MTIKKHKKNSNYFLLEVIFFSQMHPDALVAHHANFRNITSAFVLLLCTVESLIISSAHNEQI